MAGFWVEIAGAHPERPWLAVAVEAPDARTAGLYAGRQAQSSPGQLPAVRSTATLRVWVASSCATVRPGGRPVLVADRSFAV
ncbi:hypothetical protein [Streptomyces sp. NPDC059819]|uniref:hypothetical protein n=1 Tax=Streptomyces sp. NPDC059819 TaxID=3346963 RepID=UPI003651D0E0